LELLSVRDLTLDFATVDGRVRILDELSMGVNEGEIVGVVGESGSGKSSLALAITRLLDSPPAEVVAGEISFRGSDLLRLSESEMSRVRGTKIGMVFQEPLDALNPVYRVETQMMESVKVRDSARGGRTTRQEAQDLMVQTLEALCIDAPTSCLRRYPHELSGGMRQRVSIATMITESPELLILDEPTTGLDAYVQNRILLILKDIRRKLGTSILFITHDLTVASELCDKLYIVYAGRVLESGPAAKVLAEPHHPYTSTLISAVPSGFDDSPPLPVPSGELPNIRMLPTGCKFNPRCPHVREICRREEPPLVRDGELREVCCWMSDSLSERYNSS
jgi:oligopeptide/dipeptide ABC transporter ATP-binding protein